MSRKPTIAPIQFTKDELRMIDKGVDQFFREWYNGYRSAGRVYVAGRIREKVRAALGKQNGTTVVSEHRPKNGESDA